MPNSNFETIYHQEILMISHFSEPPSEIVLTEKCQMHMSLLVFLIFITDLFHDAVCLTLNLPCHLEVFRFF